MKYNSIIILAISILIFSCSKETKINQSNRNPAELIKKITDKLSATDSISTFNNALKNLNLSEEEIAGGITLLVPVNGNSGIAGKIGYVGDSVVSVDENLLRDNIIKGIFDIAHLTNNLSCLSLSGKTIIIKRSADTVWANGVQIGGRQLAYNSDYMVHTIKTSLSLASHTDLPRTTSLEITVWDATRWNNSKPQGEIAQGAEVKVYASQLDYAEGKIAGKGTTDYRGIAIVGKLKGAGTYYIEATMNGKTNVFKSSDVPNQGYLKGYAIAGIFQNPAEVSSAPAQPRATPGNFQWVDLNKDGIINTSDYYSLPYEYARTINGIKLKTKVIIGFPFNK